jgi:outer membrane protein OmpU
MKRHLLASTMILAASLGAAQAEVTLSGSARMGVIDNFGADNTGFTSRARVEFTLSGETDGGLSFGASFRADNAVGANAGTAGSVFISGGFGTLSMGDVDGAANAALGQVDGVGLTGLSDLNELTYLSNGGSDFDGDGNIFDSNETVDPSALYTYSAGDLSVFVSSTNPSDNLDLAVAIGAKYTIGNVSVAAAFENNNDQDGTPSDIDNVMLGVTGTFGAVTAKAIYGQADSLGVTADQFALSLTYTADALSATAFYADDSELSNLPSDITAGSAEAYGVGASYDLGGGAKVVGGYVKNQTADTSAVDLGVSFSF